MTYLDGIHAGLYALGILTPLLALAALVLAARVLDVPHRVRVAKLRRNVKRSGRSYNPLTGWTNSACTCPDPDMAARSGHLWGCPSRDVSRSA